MLRHIIETACHNRMGIEKYGTVETRMRCRDGEEYIFRERALGSGAITEIFSSVHGNFKDLGPEKPMMRIMPRIC